MVSIPPPFDWVKIQAPFAAHSHGSDLFSSREAALSAVPFGIDE
jgi:hypothetical protein